MLRVLWVVGVASAFLVAACGWPYSSTPRTPTPVGPVVAATPAVAGIRESTPPAATTPPAPATALPPLVSVPAKGPVHIEEWRCAGAVERAFRGEPEEGAVLRVVFEGRVRNAGGDSLHRVEIRATVRYGADAFDNSRHVSRLRPGEVRPFAVVVHAAEAGPWEQRECAVEVGELRYRPPPAGR
jgi:hypothetical protein